MIEIVLAGRSSDQPDMSRRRAAVPGNRLNKQKWAVRQRFGGFLAAALSVCVAG